MDAVKVNVTVRDGGIEPLRHRLQDQVDANRIALNMRMQAQMIAYKARD